MTVDVGLDDRSYQIVLSPGLLSELPLQLKAAALPGKVAVITNTDLDALYGRKVLESLVTAGYDADLIVLPEGEEHKTLTTLNLIYDELIGLGYDRGCSLIALGGGVIGDTVGFAAATFLRGVPFVQIPTSLLAQVDSSVGGKTAVNHPLGKNLIGAFYQPKRVLIDIDTLKTLDRRELASGMAEVIKYGMIRDGEFFSWLEDNVGPLMALEPQSLMTAIRRSCQIKAEIVAADEREQSVRALLNFGHTFGHAIESLAGYGQWRHGEAVAVGMLVAAQIAQSRRMCAESDVFRLRTLLQRFELPVDFPSFAFDDYISAMQRDKKVSDGTLTMVLNSGIGKAELVRIVDIRAEFERFFQGRKD